MTDRNDYDSMLLTYTVNGEGILRYRNQVYKVEKGQIFIIDCMEYQYYGTGDTGEWEFNWVHFNGSESRNYINQILECNGPVFKAAIDSIIPGYFIKIQDMVNSKAKRADVIISKMIVEMLTELLLKSYGTEDINDSYMPLLVQCAIRKIDRDFSSQLNLDELAKELCVSKFYLSRLFKKHTGYSPYEYIINQRLNHAKNFLKTTEWTVGEISQKVGFESSSHFIKIFSQHENTTPLKFRRYWR